MNANENVWSVDHVPRLVVTLGDVGGIGPEVAVAAIHAVQSEKQSNCVVVGHPAVLARAAGVLNLPVQIHCVDSLSEGFTASQASTSRSGELPIVCWNPLADNEVSREIAAVLPGTETAVGGFAAYEYLVAAARAAIAGECEAIVTAPLSKAALHMAGINYPGHTEILARECGVDEFGMMLYLPAGDRVRGLHGLGVVHVTLHTSIASVPKLITAAAVMEKTILIDRFLRSIGVETPRIAVCALNPHAGEQGLFGDEEQQLIMPGIAVARDMGVRCSGPIPADTCLQRAIAGEFDGVVAMYHDQGHIALKLIGFGVACNITLGLPFVRTSPSHGTAFDLAGLGVAHPDGMIAAMRIAATLAAQSAGTHKNEPFSY